jgi:radical SAM/Cys-rich protein
VEFSTALERHGIAPLRRARVDTLQLNLTRRCNLACQHCHVESSPRRTEAMDATTVERALVVLAASPGVSTLDLTGGAPELHPGFRALVARARRLGREVIDRCNLTVFYEPGCGDLPDFLACHQVRVIASLPCYTRDNVERQRGRDVFDRSIEALRALNALGYGRAGSPLRLDLVYNPLGASLPPPQAQLERDYRRELGEAFGIEFHQLLALANMPIKRFAAQLERSGERAAYQSLLVANFNPAAVPHLMCRFLVSVDYRGRLFDCDFNQQLELAPGAPARTLWDIDSLDELDETHIATAAHCFGCAAGAGSSCGGALLQGTGA